MDADTTDFSPRRRAPGPDGTLARMVAHPTDAQREAGQVVTDFSVFSPRCWTPAPGWGPSKEGEYELTDAVNVLINQRTLGWR